MKILHVIPAAFHYFDDIRDSAMSLADKQRLAGAEIEAYTIQYGAVSAAEKRAVRSAAPAVDFAGLFGQDEVIKAFNNFDLVHLHLPMLGLLGGVIKWKESGRAVPLAVTYWRDVETSDLFSYFVRWYAGSRLKRILELSDAIISFVPAIQERSVLYRSLPEKDKVYYIKNVAGEMERDNVHLTIGENRIKLSEADMEAYACLSIYSKIINK